MKNKLDVNIYCEFLSDGWRGIQRYTEQVTAGLSLYSEKYRPNVVRPPERWKLASPFVGRRLIYPLSMVLQKREHEADIYHIVDQSYSHLVNFLNPDRTVVTCHDLEFLHQANKRNFLFRKFLLHSLSRAAAIITPTEAIRLELKGILPEVQDRIHTIHNSISPNFCELPSEAREIFRKRRNWSGKKILLHVGDSQMPRKNFRFLLMLLRELPKDFCLVQVGSQLSPDSKNYIEENGITNRIENYPDVELKELIEIYQASDVVLLPSRYEGFGYTALEGTFCGTPTLAAPISALMETAVNLVEFEKLEIAAWKEKLLRGLKKPNEDLISRAKWHYSPVRQISAMQNVYNLVLEKSEGQKAA